MTTRHDVLIVGGGLVGASLAIALDRLGLSTGLVEATPLGQMPAVFDQRNLSFAVTTVNALGALGVMRRLRMPDAPIRRIHVSRRGDFGRVRLDAADYGRERFGQVVVARDFGDALAARLDELAQLTRYRPARFVRLDAPAAGLRRVHLDGPDGPLTLAAPLLVGADGSASAVRAALGIGAVAHDYGQTAFVTRVRAERAPDGTAYERFGAAGPTALLPRGDRHWGLVHAVPSEQADAVAALDAAGWLARVQAACGWRSGRFLESGPRSRYPLLRVLAARLTAPQAVLLGNAAQAIHPLGAQGFNLGLRDALTLAELIEDGLAPGDPALLDAYVTRRLADRERTLAFSDTLARLTCNPSPLLRPLRSLGMVLADRVDAVQMRLVGGAMGFRGAVPRLCRDPLAGAAA